MKLILTLILSLGALFGGFQCGSLRSLKGKTSSLDTTYPIKERKTFVFLVYAYNDALWIERTLRSLLEQEYDYYRIVLIDDGSQDATFQVAKQYIAESLIEDKVIWIRNEKKEGFLPCLHREIQNILDQEIVVVLKEKCWLSQSGVLTRLNQTFQNPNIWASSSEAIEYPSYKQSLFSSHVFYAAVLKQVPLAEMMQDPNCLEKIAKGKTAHISEPLFFQYF